MTGSTGVVPAPHGGLPSSASPVPTPASPPEVPASRRLRPGRLGPLEVLRIGGRGLAARRLRSTLTALGIAIGIAAMLAVLGISEASRASLLAVLDRLGTNLLTVTPGQTIFGADATLPTGASSMIRRIGPIDAVSAVTTVAATVRRTDHIDPGATGGIGVLAAETSLLDTLGGSMARGRFLDAASERYPTAVLGAVAAQRLGIVDLDAPIQVWIGERWFTVIGILDPLPLTPEFDRAVLIGLPAAEEAFDTDPAPTTIYVRANPSRVAEVRNVLGATANPEHPEEIRVSRPSDVLEAKAAAATTFTGLFLGLGAVALLVGGLGIANVMLMAVLERRSEIGLRRALGATREHVAGQFLAEAILLAGTGGALGVLLGTGLAAAYANSQGWPAVVPVAGVVAGIGGAILIGVVAGLYPALRAAGVPPTEALRTG
jgi:putative ABC transport system permease protein